MQACRIGRQEPLGSNCRGNLECLLWCRIRQTGRRGRGDGGRRGQTGRFLLLRPTCSACPSQQYLTLGTLRPGVAMRGQFLRTSENGELSVCPRFRKLYIPLLQHNRIEYVLHPAVVCKDYRLTGGCARYYKFPRRSWNDIVKLLGTAMNLFIQIVIFIFSLIGAKGAPTHAQSPRSIPKTFAQLQVEETTDQATDQFLKMGPNNVTARAYLAAHLPPLIGHGLAGKPHVWLNSVRLAGAFQIAEAIPSLAKYIAGPAGTPRGGTIAEVERLDPLPAGKALAQIGEPAIPTLVEILNTGTHREKWVAYRALFLIGSPSAIKELRNHLGHESDLDLMSEIQKALEGK